MKEPDPHSLPAGARVSAIALRGNIIRDAPRARATVIGTDEIRERIVQAIPGSEVEVRDLTGTGDHFEVRVVAGSFSGVSAIDRHRMVYAAFQDVMGGALHALSIKAAAPGE